MYRHWTCVFAFGSIKMSANHLFRLTKNADGHVISYNTCNSRFLGTGVSVAIVTYIHLLAVASQYCLSVWVHCNQTAIVNLKKPYFALFWGIWKLEILPGGGAHFLQLPGGDFLGHRIRLDFGQIFSDKKESKRYFSPFSFPLFTAISKVVYEGHPPPTLIDMLKDHFWYLLLCE
jgi:hypothetical protein